MKEKIDEKHDGQYEDKLRRYSQWKI